MEIYITSDNITNTATDNQRINEICQALTSKGHNCHNYGLGPNTHYSVLTNSQDTALIVDIYGGACAGTIWEMGLESFRKLKGNRKIFSVWIPPAANITGLAWLPRAHDDNFSPTNFTGLKNPDLYLKQNGYNYSYSKSTNEIIEAILNEIGDGKITQRDLKIGDTGEDVKSLKTFLKQAIHVHPQYYVGVIDTIFDLELRKSILNFQHDHKLKEDGIVGPVTRKILGWPWVDPVIVKSAFRTALEDAVGSYDDFTQYYNRIKAKSWQGYNNDVYNQLEEIKRLKGNLPLNCSDHSQLGYAVANDFGYTARFVHIMCKSGGGHIVLDVKGHEFGDKWVRVDLAAAANSNYPIGSYWCSTGTVASYNDPWLLSDDGKT